MSFRINYKFPLITGLNKAEESRNEDLDFEDKNKWKFIKSQIVPPPPRGGVLPYIKSLILLPAGITSAVLLTHLLFSTLILPVVIYKKIILALLSWAKNES